MTFMVDLGRTFVTSSFSICCRNKNHCGNSSVPHPVTSGKAFVVHPFHPGSVTVLYRQTTSEVKDYIVCSQERCVIVATVSIYLGKADKSFRLPLKSIRSKAHICNMCYEDIR